MGRKPTDKVRKQDDAVLFSWAEILFPYLQKYGLRGLTMDRAASILKKSKSTIYEYLKSKEDIAAVIVDYKIEKISGFSDFLEDDTLDYSERIKRSVEYFSKNIVGVTNLFLKDLYTEFPDQYKKIEEFRKTSVQTLHKFYETGMKKGYFKNYNPSVIAMLDDFFFTVLTDPDFLEEKGLSFDEAIMNYLNLKLYGLNKAPDSK
jgi:AcrR family transcriptional regulator